MRMKMHTYLSPQCLQHLDVSVLGELVPKLCELLKSGVGLGTKVHTYYFNRLCVSFKVAFVLHSGTFSSDLSLHVCRVAVQA